MDNLWVEGHQRQDRLWISTVPNTSVFEIRELKAHQRR
jgi:hypothetical protein